MPLRPGEAEPRRGFLTVCPHQPLGGPVDATAPILISVHLPIRDLTSQSHRTLNHDRPRCCRFESHLKEAFLRSGRSHPTPSAVALHVTSAWGSGGLGPDRGGSFGCAIVVTTRRAILRHPRMRTHVLVSNRVPAIGKDERSASMSAWRM